MQASQDAGWTPLEDQHAALLRYESLRRQIGDAAVDGPCGPVVEWPGEWGAWSLADHRAAIARHFAECERIAYEESRS